ncbi:hypothetical protein [Microbulbifer thermotolerans]|uniref:hypothetical protein n=1 Tax=Microbulbifer thermotolerans TaxID=252514 RepID=UPI0022487FC0|nr:hypothetical protein [Microbulbifer thermotolerans]MCX2833110.1 hypothetical protein [Microbulbifer thermotolerans]
MLAGVMFSRRVTIKILIPIIAIFLTACSFVEVQDYEHELTHDIRQSIIYSGQQEIDGIGSREFVIVPNFREFTSSFSTNRAFLFVVSKEITSINVMSAKLHNKDTGLTELIELGERYQVSKSVGETGYFIGFVPLLKESCDKFGLFNTAKELELIITYNIAGGPEVTEKLTLRLITRKEIAWIT